MQQAIACSCPSLRMLLWPLSLRFARYFYEGINQKTLHCSQQFLANSKGQGTQKMVITQLWDRIGIRKTITSKILPFQIGPSIQCCEWMIKSPEVVFLAYSPEIVTQNIYKHHYLKMRKKKRGKGTWCRYIVKWRLILKIWRSKLEVFTDITASEHFILCS